MVERSLDRLYVASPCSADWEAMRGSDWVRFCDQCQLNVYNISAMTTTQAQELITKTEGRLCTRLYRRGDGTIITRDCPFGMRALKRRVSRTAGAVLGAILSLFINEETVWADHNHCAHYKAKVIKLQSQRNSASIQGTVFYMKNKVLAGADVTLIDKETTRIYTATTNDKGRFDFSSLASGSYAISIQFRGFVTFRTKNLTIKTSNALQLEDGKTRYWSGFQCVFNVFEI